MLLALDLKTGQHAGTPSPLGMSRSNLHFWTFWRERRYCRSRKTSTKFKQKLDVPIPATPLPLGWILPMLGDEAQHPGRTDTDLKEMPVGIMPGRSDRNFPDTASHWCPKRRGLFPRSSDRGKYRSGQRSHEVLPKSSNVGHCCSLQLNWSSPIWAGAQRSKPGMLETPALAEGGLAPSLSSPLSTCS